MSLAREVDLRRPSTNADVWGRYYTSSEVSRTLVDVMTGVRPKLVLELGAGQGALANAAQRKWKSANFVTVDTDLAATASLARLTSKASHIHHAYDALDVELADRIGVPLGSVDVGLCNPPYVRPRWRSSFGRILEEAGLSGALQTVHDAGADLLFIAQNLRLLRQRGKLGLILPDGLITGQKYRGVRQVLLREHHVELVVQLPRRAFAKTEAQTYLLVLSKCGGETQQVQLSQMKEGGEISAPISVTADVAKLRLDYAFHALSATMARPGDKRQMGKSVGAYVHGLLRGTTSSSQIDSCPLPVFHLSDFPGIRESAVVPMVPAKFIQSAGKTKALPDTYKIAKAGDILIARIGRNLHEKVCLLPRGTCVISDCIFAVRSAPEHRDALLTYLLSNDGKAALKAASHGVGAKYLSRSDVLGLVLPA
ncbi:N-6 DNA methylase [Achromobacter sp. UBA4530]|uniref:N-6 DNA methylase n=1 Tax=Achromobacter sp. UBA4530 TaxID=1945912 RepID=UPI00257A9779|nr:N-6 DNA methylase [Achromobacter sp. UBA4530]